MRNVFRKYAYALVFLTSNALLQAQDTLVLQPIDCERRFIQENRTILLEQLNIEIAKAQEQQSKLWENPNLSIQDINFWAGRRNVELFGDGLPALFGKKFGKNQQFAIEIEQLIYTGKKRRKRMQVANLATQQTEISTLLVIRDLKLDFRYLLIDLIHQHKAQEIYSNQINSLQQLISAYENQQLKGNVTKAEVMRLKAHALELNKIIHNYNLTIKGIEHQIKTLIHISSQTPVRIDYSAMNLNNILQTALPDLAQLIDTAFNYRSEFKAMSLQEDYFKAVEDYEKAQRIPDIKINGVYDRGSNFMLNFIGFGVSMDLPIWNRNQGNIAAAQIERKKASTQEQQVRLQIENEIANAYEQFIATKNFLKDINVDYEIEMDKLLEAYTKNFSNRNMSLLEYLDFLDTYIENKLLVQETLKDLAQKAADLNHAIGKDFISFE